MKKLHFFLFFIFIFSIGIAQTHVWTGNGGDNNWFTAANWDVNTIPDNSSEVLIDGAFSVVIANSTANASTIDVLNLGELVVISTLNLSNTLNIHSNGSLVFSSGNISNGTIDNDGMLIITGANSKSFNTVEINNNAIINIVNSGVTDLNNGTVLNNGNGAELLIDSNGGLIQEGTGGTVNNEGLISKHNNGAPGAFYMIFDTNNHGVIEVQEGQTFLFLTIAADFHNYADGTMTGTGAFDITANFFNEGRVTPGDEGLGTLEIVNNFVMSPGSVLDININGTGTGEFDVLDIFGDPDLEGEIEVQAVLTPDDIGATFPIVLAQLGINSCAFPATVFSINGSEMYSFDVHCNPNDVTLEFTGILLGQEDVTAEGAWGLYPNPSNGEIHILLSELLLSDDVQYTVYNQLGQVLREVKLDETNSTIDLSDLPSGLYFIQPQSNDKRFAAKRFVKI